MSSMIIAIDGPAASGKGTLAARLADYFDLARLDTGLIYRAAGWKLLQDNGNLEDPAVAGAAAQALSVADLEKDGLRREEAGLAASKVAALPNVRAILLAFQRDFAACPPNGKSGAVIDGRDIGTVVCPGAPYKLFLKASANVRATRRYKELQARGAEAIYARILRDIKERDARDMSRSVAPLEPAKDAFVLDTSDLDADAVFAAALQYINSQNF